MCYIERARDKGVLLRTYWNSIDGVASAVDGADASMFKGGRDVKDERSRKRVNKRNTKTNTASTTVGSRSSRNL